MSFGWQKYGTSKPPAILRDYRSGTSRSEESFNVKKNTPRKALKFNIAEKRKQNDL